ncbi:hypothetical protein ACFWUZ_26525 [Streptomyces sp. NPDC058646]|uniref:hypothetical protein n=1 Tax=Streptomyces sp. NPDC058646 TaxID=3346574 RepID=UPI00364B434C
MKLAYLTAAAVLLAPIAFVAQPAQAFNTHTVILTGTLEVYDHGGLFGGSATSTDAFDRRVTLTHNRPRASVLVVECAGGETRAELRVTLMLLGSEVVSSGPRLRLYEESRCDNNDLDDENWPVAKNVALNTSRGWRLYVSNDEWGSYYDSADAAFAVTNWPGAGP